MDIKRHTGDAGIDYHVNDSDLDIETLDDKSIIVIGERHGNISDMDLIKRLIKAFKADYVLVEGLGDYILSDRHTKDLKNKAPLKSHYYQYLTKLWIEFSRQFDIPFIGIEYTDLMKHSDEIRNSLKECFALREAHFIKMIDQYAKKGKVIAVVGDTHLRTIKTEVLGPPSPLYQKYNGKKSSAIIRSAEGEIE